MNRPTIFLMMFIFSAAIVFGHENNSKQNKEERVKATLMQLERDIGQANVKRDYDFFDRVEAPEFVFTDSGGNVSNKQEDLAETRNAPNPDVKLVSYAVDDMKVFLYGSTAVVTGRVTTNYMIKGKEVLGHSRFTDVFVRRQGRWLLVAGHSSVIRKPAA